MAHHHQIDTEVIEERSDVFAEEGSVVRTVFCFVSAAHKGTMPDHHDPRHEVSVGRGGSEVLGDELILFCTGSQPLIHRPHRRLCVDRKQVDRADVEGVVHGGGGGAVAEEGEARGIRLEIEEVFVVAGTSHVRDAGGERFDLSEELVPQCLISIRVRYVPNMHHDVELALELHGFESGDGGVSCIGRTHVPDKTHAHSVVHRRRRGCPEASRRHAPGIMAPQHLGGGVSDAIEVLGVRGEAGEDGGVDCPEESA